MAWDFETDPEFQQKLDWMRAFIDTELIPLEPVFRRIFYKLNFAPFVNEAERRANAAPTQITTTTLTPAR